MARQLQADGLVVATAVSALRALVASKVRSILEMWYPGQEGGPATADLLLGNVNPGGKLPVTFPADATKIPTYDAGCTDTW